MSFLFIKRKVDRLRKIIDPSHCYLFVEKSLEKLLLIPFIHILTRNIFTAFEEFPSRETRAVFLNISKAFGKV